MTKYQTIIKHSKLHSHQCHNVKRFSSNISMTAMLPAYVYYYYQR